MLYHRQMILQCTQCKFRYTVAGEQIGPKGRTVRCANCKHMWFQKQLTQEESLADMERMLAEINAQPKPMPQPLSPGANLPAKRRAEIPAGLKAAVFGMAAIAACLTLFLYFPGMFGFSSSDGLALAEVHLLKLDEIKDNHPVYAISGKIVNLTEKPLTLPRMRITLVDEEGNTLQPWEDSSAQGKIIAPHEEIPFNFDDLNIKFNKGVNFVMDLGNALELSLRRKPQ